MKLKVREQIKSLLATRDITMKELAQMLSLKLGREYSLANLSAKLIRGTLTYNEVLIIAELLNYEIEFVEIK